MLGALGVRGIDKEYRTCGGLTDIFNKLPTSTITGLAKVFQGKAQKMDQDLWNDAKKFLPGNEKVKNNVGKTVVKAKEDVVREVKRFFNKL